MPAHLGEDQVGRHEPLLLTDVGPCPGIETCVLADQSRRTCGSRPGALDRGRRRQAAERAFECCARIGQLAHPVVGTLAGGHVRLLRRSEAFDQQGRLVRLALEHAFRTALGDDRVLEGDEQVRARRGARRWPAGTRSHGRRDGSWMPQLGPLDAAVGLPAPGALQRVNDASGQARRERHGKVQERQRDRHLGGGAQPAEKKM